jgi:hypothetical protein
MAEHGAPADATPRPAAPSVAATSVTHVAASSASSHWGLDDAPAEVPSARTLPQSSKYFLTE